MYSTRPRKEKAKEERDIYGNTIDEEIELQGMSRERRVKHNREKLQQKLQAGSHVSRCLPVLELLKLRPDAAWFLNPVSADDVPDYAEVIERPMDYSTIEGKLKGGAYGDDTLAFAADVRLVYSNAFKYNYDPNNQCHQAAKESLREFEKTFSSAMRAPENDGTMGPTACRYLTSHTHTHKHYTTTEGLAAPRPPPAKSAPFDPHPRRGWMLPRRPS